MQMGVWLAVYLVSKYPKTAKLNDYIKCVSYHIKIGVGFPTPNEVLKPYLPDKRYVFVSLIHDAADRYTARTESSAHNVSTANLKHTRTFETIADSCTTPIVAICANIQGYKTIIEVPKSNSG